MQTINTYETGSETVGVSGTTFEHPTGLAADDAGNLHIVDTFAGTIYLQNHSSAQYTTNS